MAEYYFLSASFPSLVLGKSLKISLEALLSDLRLNLSERDWNKVNLLRGIFDVYNIKALLLGGPIDFRGSLDKEELEEALMFQDRFPQYLFHFLDRFKSVDEQIAGFSGLISLYLKKEAMVHSGFIGSYFNFERAWRLMTTVWRCEQFGRDPLSELHLEDDIRDHLIIDIINQKELFYSEPFVDYRELKRIYSSSYQDLGQYNKEITEWRLYCIENLAEGSPSSIEAILSYLARFLVVEQWNELDQAKGQMVFEQLIG